MSKLILIIAIIMKTKPLATCPRSWLTVGCKLSATTRDAITALKHIERMNRLLGGITINKKSLSIYSLIDAFETATSSCKLTVWYNKKNHFLRKKSKMLSNRVIIHLGNISLNNYVLSDCGRKEAPKC